MKTPALSAYVNHVCLCVATKTSLIRASTSTCQARYFRMVYILVLPIRSASLGSYGGSHRLGQSNTRETFRCWSSWFRTSRPCRVTCRSVFLPTGPRFAAVPVHNQTTADGPDDIASEQTHAVDRILVCFDSDLDQHVLESIKRGTYWSILADTPRCSFVQNLPETLQACTASRSFVQSFDGNPSGTHENFCEHAIDARCLRKGFGMLDRLLR